MKTIITTAIFTLIFSTASVTTAHAQSTKNQLTDSSLSAGDQTPGERIAISRSVNFSAFNRVVDTTLQPENTTDEKRIQRAALEMQHKDVSTRQKPVKTVSNFNQTSSSQKHDTTKSVVGMVNAQ